MHRRSYLAGLVATATAVAGCSGGNSDGGDGGDGGIDDAEGETVLRERAGGEMNAGGGGAGGDGGIGGGGGGPDSVGDQGEPGESDAGSDDILPDDGTPHEYPFELEAGERVEVTVDNEGFKTGFRLFDPEGETALESEVAEKRTVTHTAEHSGEYSLLVVPTDSAVVKVTKYPPAEEDEE